MNATEGFLELSGETAVGNINGNVFTLLQAHVYLAGLFLIMEEVLYRVLQGYVLAREQQHAEQQKSLNFQNCGHNRLIQNREPETRTACSIRSSNVV